MKKLKKKTPDSNFWISDLLLQHICLSFHPLPQNNFVESKNVTYLQKLSHMLHDSYPLKNQEKFEKIRLLKAFSNQKKLSHMLQG